MNGGRIAADASIAFRALSRGRNDLVAMLRPAGRLADFLVPKLRLGNALVPEALLRRRG